MGLMDDLGSDRIGIDTAIFIYFIEAAPGWLPLITPLFRAADNGQRLLITSSITLLEVLVIPYRANNEALAAEYERLLTSSRGIQMIDVTRDQVRRASRLRALTGMRTPDALQLGAAQEAGCSAFLTNDRRLPAVPGLRILQLASYVR